MKLFQICVLIFSPISLLSQEVNKFEIADSIIDVREIMKADFDDEIMQRIEALELTESSYSVGILELPTFPTQNLILILLYIKINCNIYVIDF